MPDVDQDERKMASKMPCSTPIKTYSRCDHGHKTPPGVTNILRMPLISTSSMPIKNTIDVPTQHVYAMAW
jgi:hypothetical protein